jgi:plastocyanin
VLLTALVTALVTACAGSGAGTSVDMSSAQRFEPEELEIQVGTELTFTNGSDEAHTVTAYEDSLPDQARYFASGGADDEAGAREGLAEALIEPGQTFTVTLDTPGTYRYFCIPHESAGMKGTIVVSR